MTDGAQHAYRDDLDVGLTAAAEVNRVIVAADAKAGFILAAHGALLAGLASSVGSAPSTTSTSLQSVTAIGTAIGAGLVVFLLIGALWPRTADPTARWFAYSALRPGTDGQVPVRPAVNMLAEQAWAQAHALAAIARRKYRWLRGALIVGAADIVAFCVYVAIVACQRA